MNLLSAFFEGLGTREHRIAIVAADGKAASFAELTRASAALAAAWRLRGLARGDRVLVAAPLSIDLYISLIALWRVGAVAVFPEPSLGLRGVRHAANVTKPKAVLTAGPFRVLRSLIPELWRIPLSLGTQERGSGLDVVEPVNAEHPALISFTSGSTGPPKAIVRTHAMLGRQNAYVADLLAPKRDHEIDLVAFPVFVLANVGMGTTSVLPNWDLRRHDTIDPSRILALLAKHRVTRALLPPSVCEKLCLSASALNLSAVFTGGGPVFPRLLERMADRLPLTDIVTVYGSTEAEPIAHIHATEITACDWTAMRQGAGLLAGTPIRAATVAIRDDEIVVSGDHVNKGYLDPKDDHTTKICIDGQIRHRTGDAGRIDSAGRLWLLGRKNGAVGQLFPFCVEAAAQYGPGISRCALPRH
jgi:acyl-coenzyme A synthetase/AMP-(fatty) acid ligase